MNNLPSDTQENGQKVHHIKLGATFFEEVASGEKTFELRKNDRDYKKGDILEMMEFKDGKNTGRTVRVLGHISLRSLQVLRTDIASWQHHS